MPMFIFLSPVLLVGNQLLKSFRCTFVYLLRVTTFTEVRRTFALSAVLVLSSLKLDGILSNQNLSPYEEVRVANEIILEGLKERFIFIREYFFLQTWRSLRRPMELLQKL